MAFDKELLKKSLAKELGWDLGTLEGIVEAIEAASGQSEVDEIVQDYLGGGAATKRFVEQFLAAGRGGHAASSASSSAGVQQTFQGTPVRQGQRQAGSLVVTHKAKKGSPAAKPGPERPERPVANCLCCGKVYRTRETTKDVLRFLELGCVCTFCGAKIALARGAHSEERPPAAERTAGQSAAAGRAGGAGEAAAAGKVAEAVAFKDRLVEYDRNSASRTQVFDDQSDFFEVDANAWLTREEREALKQQERAAAEAEEARRRRVTVTVDLLGRQVLVSEEARPSAAAGEAAQLAGVAASATAAEAPQGGGSGAAAAAEAAGLLTAGPPALRIRPAPALAGPAPIFVPSAALQQELRGGGGRPVRGQPRAQPKRPPRLQHEDPFEGFEVGLQVLSVV